MKSKINLYEKQLFNLSKEFKQKFDVLSDNLKNKMNDDISVELSKFEERQHEINTTFNKIIKTEFANPEQKRLNNLIEKSNDEIIDGEIKIGKLQFSKYTKDVKGYIYYGRYKDDKENFDKNRKAFLPSEKTKYPQVGKKLQLNGDSYVRKNPSKKSNFIHIVRAGEQATITNVVDRNGYVWVQIETSGKRIK